MKVYLIMYNLLLTLGQSSQKQVLHRQFEVATDFVAAEIWGSHWRKKIQSSY